MRKRLAERMLADLLPRWGAHSAAPLEGGKVNLVYRIATDTRQLILRITDGTIRKRKFILEELRWIEHLRAHGIKVCGAVPTRAGTLLEEVTPDDGSRPFFAVAFECAPGERVRRFHLNRPHLTALGRLLGTMHAASLDYPRVQRMAWDHSLPSYLRLIADDTEAANALHDAAERIRALPTDRDCFGLVHNDLHMHNYHLDGEAIWLFDFDGCLYNWYASDIACTWYFSLSWTAGTDVEIWHKMRQPIIHSLLEGYQQVHAISNEWIERIPLFLRFRALSLYAFLFGRAGRDCDADQRMRLQAARQYALDDMPTSVLPML